MADRAAMREAFEGRVDEFVSSEPSKMAGAKGKPQAFSRGGGLSLVV